MDPIAEPVSNNIPEEEIEDLEYNELGNNCDNPKKFLIDFEIAKRERFIRDERKAELINSLAEEELRWKLSGKQVTNPIKKTILERRIELAKLMKLEEMDERLKFNPMHNGVKEYHKPLIYEYFKVVAIRDSTKSRGDKIFDLEDGDGSWYEFDFFAIAGGLTDKNYRYTPFYRNILNVYRDASYYGAMIAIGKAQNDLIMRDIYALEKMPQHLLYDQRIDPLNDSVPVVTASVIAVPRAHAIVDQSY